MRDLKITWSGAELAGSWQEDEEESGLRSAVLISLFSDARADKDDALPARETDPRGWWGEAFDPAHPFGCKWWLRWREKQTDETAALIADDAYTALGWMVSDGLLREIAVSAEWIRRGVLSVSIVLTRPDGTTERLEGEITT